VAGIVVGVDGSDYSGRALAWAMREAAQHHVALTGFTHLRLGSVGSKVTHHAASPVVLVPADH
jgi:nucleotide-binding universal stress UspA family protein